MVLSLLLGFEVAWGLSRLGVTSFSTDAAAVSSISSVAALGPHVPGAYGWMGGGSVISRCMIRQVSSTPSCRWKRVLFPVMAA